MTDKIDLHIIELKKLENVSEEEKLEYGDIIKWARFISAKTWEEYENFGREDEAMAEAVKELKRINADEIERLKYLHREIALRDEYQYKREAEERGEKMTLEIVERLLTGMSPEEIINEGFESQSVWKAEKIVNKK